MPRTVRTARAPTDLKPNLIRIKKRNDERADRRKGGERVKEFQQLGTSDQVFGRPRTGYVAHTILTDAALMMRATGRVARAELDEMRPMGALQRAATRAMPPISGTHRPQGQLLWRSYDGSRSRSLSSLQRPRRSSDRLTEQPLRELGVSVPSQDIRPQVC